MANFDWNKSGRIDTFEFQKVKIGSKKLSTILGKLEGVVSGTLTYSYDSDTVVSGTLELVDQEQNLADDEFMVRIIYKATLDGETVERTLGTFYYTANLTYDKGMYKGNLTLSSALTRYSNDCLPKNWTLKAGKTYKACFQQVIKSFGGWGGLDSFSTNSKVKKNKVFKAGESVLKVLNHIAQECGGEISVTPEGKTIMRQYNTPSVKKKKGEVWEITTAKQSVVCQGMEITNSIKEIPNRVVCVYSKDKKTYYGTATLAANHARSHGNIKKWITKVYNVNNCKKPYESNLKKQAAKKLKAANHKRVNYTFECFYQPIEVGECVRLTYGDISITGIVRSIDLSIGVGAKMRVSIRKV